MSWRAFVIAAVVLGFASSGCSGSGSSDGDQSPPDSTPQSPGDDSPPEDPPPEDPPSEEPPAEPVLTFAVDDVTVAESSESVSFIVRAAGDGFSGEASVDFTTIDGSALADIDYVEAAGTLTFDGPGTQTVTVSLIDDDEPEGEEAFQLELGNPLNGEIDGGTGTATVSDDDADVCTAPVIDEDADTGVFLWKHCPSGAWRVRVTAAGEERQYSGRVSAAEPFTEVTRVGVEAGDEVDTSAPNEIGFSLTAAGDSDGFNFIPPQDAGTCFELASPAGGTVFVGGQRLELSGAFDLDTLGSCAGGGEADATGYNVVVVFTDDQRFDTIEHMPNLSTRIVPIGVVFDNAYVPTPLCCPARANLYSGGFLSQNTGVLTNNPPNGGMAAFVDDNNIGRRFQEAGYRTQFVGKWFNDYIRHAPYVPPGWDSFTGRATFADADWSNFPYVTASSAESSTTGEEVSSNGQYHVYFERDQILEFIDSQPPDDPAAKPYFVIWATTPPHEPATPDEMDENAFADFTYDGRGVGEEDLSDKPEWVQNYATNPFRPHGDVEDIRGQLRTLLAVDRGLGTIIDLVEARGEMDRTVFVFLSDNGYMWGEHGIWAKNKAYEESIRVPLVVAVPGVEPRRDEHLVYAVLDVPATIQELAGISAPSDGTSLMPILRDPNADWRSEMFFEKFGEAPAQDGIWAGMRRDEWKFVEYVNGETELYDLAADPFELENLADDASYADIRESLQQATEDRLGLGIRPPFRNIDGRVGEPYSLDFEPWGGEPPLSWTLESGELPPGLALDAATGEISGTPTAAGSWKFSIRVTGSGLEEYTGDPRTFVSSNYTIEIR